MSPQTVLASQDYTHPDDHNLPNYDMTPGFKPFTVLMIIAETPIFPKNHVWFRKHKPNLRSLSLMFLRGKPPIGQNEGPSTLGLYHVTRSNPYNFEKLCLFLLQRRVLQFLFVCFLFVFLLFASRPTINMGNISCNLSLLHWLLYLLPPTQKTKLHNATSTFWNKTLLPMDVVMCAICIGDICIRLTPENQHTDIQTC